MEIQKVKITKDNTCMVVYSNADGDVITHQGGNIIHKDLREAMNALIPHLAVLPEQREAYNRIAWSLGRLGEGLIGRE